MCGGGSKKSKPAPAPAPVKPQPEGYTNDNGVIRNYSATNAASTDTQMASFGSELAGN